MEILTNFDNMNRDMLFHTLLFNYFEIWDVDQSQYSIVDQLWRLTKCIGLLLIEAKSEYIIISVVFYVLSSACYSILLYCMNEYKYLFYL